jgi:hypothetical protein
MTTRGPNWSTTEHKLLCRAFIATSEDPIVGTDQKGADFQLQLHENYKKIVGDYNRDYATRYHERKCNSNFNQFKKLSKAVLKYIGVEDNAGEPPSGDSDKAVWLEGCRDAFCDRYPDMKNLLDSVLLVKELLQESPKWEAFEKKKEEANKKKRPQGTKKAKQEKSDERLVKRVLSVSTAEKSKKQHMKNKDAFMSKMSNGIDVITRNMSDKNDQELLSFCSPRTQKKLAAELMRERIKRMKNERKSATFTYGSTTISSVSCDVASDKDEDNDDNNESDNDDNESVQTFTSEQRRRLDAIEDSPTDARLARERLARERKLGGTTDIDDEDDDDDST